MIPVLTTRLSEPAMKISMQESVSHMTEGHQARRETEIYSTMHKHAQKKQHNALVLDTVLFMVKNSRKGNCCYGPFSSWVTCQLSKIPQQEHGYECQAAIFKLHSSHRIWSVSRRAEFVSNLMPN